MWGFADLLIRDKPKLVWIYGIKAYKYPDARSVVDPSSRALERLIQSLKVSNRLYKM